MFITISQTSQLQEGATIMHKAPQEYYELGPFNPEESAYFIYPEGYSGSFSKKNNLGFGAAATHLMENFLVESTDAGFYDEGKGSATV